MTQKHMNIVMCVVVLIGAVVALMESGRTDRLQARVEQLETIAAYHVETMNSLVKNQIYLEAAHKIASTVCPEGKTCSYKAEDPFTVYPSIPASSGTEWPTQPHEGTASRRNE